MPRLSLFSLLLALLALPGRGDDDGVVKIGSTAIKVPVPAGMAAAADDPATAKAVDDMTPDGCVLLRAFMENEARPPAKPADDSTNSMMLCVYAFKDVQQDIYSGDFIEFVGKIANDAAHTVLISQNSSFDFEETENRLAAFQKDTGIAAQPDGALYSLGMVSRSDGCVSFLDAQYLTVTQGGRTQREKCLSVEGYLLLNSKLVYVTTWVTGPSVFANEVLPLKHAAEKYQIVLQQLNDQ